jgi:hypothetical protein
MFTFVLKENKAAIEITITRILLALAGIGSLFYASQVNYFIKITVAIILLAASYFVNTISERFKIDRFFLLLIAAIILLIGTGSFIFSGIIVCYAVLLKFLQRTAEVIIDNDTIILKKIFSDDVFVWADLNNIILKDGLLTLDFVDNKLLQLIIDEDKTPVNENIFNSFCKEHLVKAQ